MIKYGLISFLILILSGCGTIKKTWTDFAPDIDTQYLEAQSEPSLIMPEGMTMNAAYLSDPYPLPVGPLPKAGEEPIDILPPTLKEENDASTTS